MESWSTNSSANASAAELYAGGMGRLMGAEFYAGHTLEVARRLLGKLLVVRESGHGAVNAGRIVETEAYRAGDPASHSCRGKTPRSSIMFDEPGRAYVYFIYGMYEMLNFVTEPADCPGAVLIRAVEPVAGIDRMRARRKGRSDRELANGPGRLCRALGVRMKDNGSSLTSGRISVHDDGFRPARIFSSPRVGISSAQDKYWRFFIDGNPYVSRVKENQQARRAGWPA